jgi:hypothetical protein
LGSLHQIPLVILVDSEDTQKLIFQHLVYRKDCRGRALVQHLPQFGLKKWDRLTPTRALPNVAAFESKAPPFEATFWRMGKNGRVVHDCPILEHPQTIGFSYDDWVIDILHTWALGGISAVVGKNLRFAVQSAVFTPTSIHLDSDDRDRLAMLHIKSLVAVHYKNKKEQDPSWKLTGTEAIVTIRYV